MLMLVLLKYVLITKELHFSLILLLQQLVSTVFTLTTYILHLAACVSLERKASDEINTIYLSTKDYRK